MIVARLIYLPNPINLAFLQGQLRSDSQVGAVALSKTSGATRFLDLMTGRIQEQKVAEA